MNVWPQGGENIDLQSWLFEEDGQDFRKGAKENYSFVGQGAYSPQTITSDDIPGWTEQDSIAWNADLNLEDCLSVDLKSKSWHDTLIGEDAKWANGVYSEYQQFLAAEKAKNASPFAAQKSFPFNGVQNSPPYDIQNFMLDNVDGSELGNDLYPLTPDSLVDDIYNDIIASTNVSGDKVDFEENIHPNDPSAAVGQLGFENDHCMEDMCYEVNDTAETDKPQIIDNAELEPQIIDNAELEPQIIDNAELEPQIIDNAELYQQIIDDAEPEPQMIVGDDKPQIITVPLSEALEPKIQVINVDSVKQESSFQEQPKIIFCRRVTLPSPSARTIPTLRRSSYPLECSPIYLPSPSPIPAPSVPLKDIITEQGDDLLRDFVEMEDEVKSEPEEMEQANHRRRPFTQEERRLRKKEQNKRAAIKYREKKKEEQEKIFGSVEVLEDRLRQAKEESIRLSAEKEMVQTLLLDLLKRKRAEVIALNRME